MRLKFDKRLGAVKQRQLQFCSAAECHWCHLCFGNGDKGWFQGQLSKVNQAQVLSQWLQRG